MTGHNAYFGQLQAALQQEGELLPRLIVDLDRLDHNIDQAVAFATQTGKTLRLVEKSLPSFQLLDYIARRAGTRRLMSFHQPFLNLDAQHWPDADILLGKPMPAALAERFYQSLTGGFEPQRQLQWLIDSPERLKQYLGLAQRLGLRLNVNLELDVGLRRGGVPPGQAGALMLSALLQRIAQHPQHLRFTGFMGYEPHVAMLPRLFGRPERLLAQAMATYQARVEQVQREAPALWAQALAADGQPPLTLNTAGSPTYRLHDQEQVSNELALGSGLLKPTHFDLPSLAGHLPALFIATPVLKATGAFTLPGAGWLPALISRLAGRGKQALFIYGGNWLAEPVSPAGLTASGLYGTSSNQQVLLAPTDTALQVDDLVFMRPTQSEAVLLQFGDLLAVRAGRVVGHWPVFANQ
ncbi:alanine racemase [Pseudomonas abyssi]|uniref:Alanine racemase n=1 Tax=Pseudomonas abyssi TaxID=170540 RepID=A0A395R3C6_9PSED|nr:alanine racemase [Halopseudomonas gallaeciensis]RGP54299.1 alanine racemase [Halopseudomonas gallaeciensis]